MLVMYMIMCFSPFCADAQARSYIGYLTIFVISGHFGLNLIMMSCSTLRMLRNRYYLRRAIYRYHRKRTLIRKYLGRGGRERNRKFVRKLMEIEDTDQSSDEQINESEIKQNIVLDSDSQSDDGVDSRLRPYA